MKQLKVMGVFFILCLLIFSLQLSAAEPVVSSTELIENSNQYDKKTVLYQGEAIGDIMNRGDFAWINVSDGSNVIGIWLPVNMAEKIQYLGRYGVEGDTILISGVYYKACPEHGGDLDIHASSIEIVKSGQVIEWDHNYQKSFLYAGVFVLAIMFIVFIFKKSY